MILSSGPKIKRGNVKGFLKSVLSDGPANQATIPALIDLRLFRASTTLISGKDDTQKSRITSSKALVLADMWSGSRNVVSVSGPEDRSPALLSRRGCVGPDAPSGGRATWKVNTGTRDHGCLPVEVC
jgi:hypothetical protein